MKLLAKKQSGKLLVAKLLVEPQATEPQVEPQGQYDRQKRWRERQTSAGKCRRCSRKASLGKATCRQCRTAMRDQVRALRAERKAAGRATSQKRGQKHGQKHGQTLKPHRRVVLRALTRAR